MLTKEECVACLNYERNMSPTVRKCFEQLIEERFNPKPYTFEELKPDMWVWDEKIKSCFEIFDIHKEDMSVEAVINDREVGYRKVATLGEFEPNRFYPLTKIMFQEEK